MSFANDPPVAESERSAARPAAVDAPLPLCVDLDGTLIRSDILWESLLQLLKRHPAYLFLLPIWLLKGRANLKRQVASRVELDVALLPYHPALLGYLREVNAAGRPLVLVTAADAAPAQQVADHLGLFSTVLGSDGSLNLSGSRKAAALVGRFGSKGFDYIGNGAVDLPVWAAARGGIVVNSGQSLVRKARAVTSVDRVFSHRSPLLQSWVRALRVHQYSKNLLLLLPLAGAHKWGDPRRVFSTLLGMAAFCICASSAYMLNDLLDLDADRHHPAKQRRPFAAGEIPISHGLAAVALALAAAAGLAFSLNVRFEAILGVYFVVTLLYSLRLKQVELLDVLALAGLYTIRILAGGYAAAVTVSDWLLMFSMFLFLSLAFAKRFTELRLSFEHPSARIKGRGYLKGDVELIGAMGIASGYISVLVFGMYVTEPGVTAYYLTPRALWLACPVLLYWVSRVWLLAHRGRMDDDPIVFALTDPQSWIATAFIVLIGIAAGPR